MDIEKCKANEYRKMDIDELIAALRRDNYCLVTDDDGVDPQYDEHGNLLVCKPESGELMPVPNTEALRKLYDLPDDKWSIRPNVNKLVTDSLKGEDNGLVWMGQRSQKCNEATKLLIDLFDSSKYKSLMSDRNTIKLKIWEMIAVELESSGFKVANTVKEAGLRTFQKWRNLERTYWKFKRNPPDIAEYPRKRKPFFFDDMHAVLSKRSDYSRKLELFNKSREGITANLSGTIQEMEDILNVENVYDNADNLPIDMFQKAEESLPKEVVSLLVSLASAKYKHLINSTKYKGLKLWEIIYDEIASKGWSFASSRREGALKLRRKWNNIDKKCLSRQKKINSTCSARLRNLIVLELAKQNMNTASLTPEHSSSIESRQFPDAVETLLRLIDSEKYSKMFNSNQKMSWVWEKIYYEMEAMGFYIAGATLRIKSRKLYQKWKTLKRLFISYQLAKSKGLDGEKPPYYDLLLKIVSREILGESETVVVKQEESAMSSSECVTLSQLDHDYGSYMQDPDVGMFDISTSSAPTTSHIPVTSATTTNMTVQVDPLDVIINNPASPGTQAMCCATSQPKPTTHDQTNLSDILLQIKSLNETTLAAQQQNFGKIVSLLEEQVAHQKNLNLLFTQYVAEQSRKVKSEGKGQKLEDPRNNTKHCRSGTSEYQYILPDQIDSTPSMSFNDLL